MNTILGLSGIAQAGTIWSATGIAANPMGALSPTYAKSRMSDQSGLSSNFISGTTDFTAFVNSGVTHRRNDTESWLSQSIFTGYLVFDLGAIYTVNQFVMWNGADGATASVRGFSLSTSLTSDFGTATAVGSYTGHMGDYATVYDLVNSQARYVRLDIGGNFGNSCCIAIGEVAFDIEAVAPSEVPEPGSIALLALGAAGIGFSRRRIGKRPGK